MGGDADGVFGDFEVMGLLSRHSSTEMRLASTEMRLSLNRFWMQWDKPRPR
jgi:hypothetical protein